LALSHAREKEELLNKLLEQKDNEIKALRELLETCSARG
jgi:DNA-binding helix-turn-helix protein